MTEVKGVYAAAVTPRGKHGEINFGAAFDLIDFLCKGGVNGILLCGATGEFAALNPEERSRLVYLSIKRSRVPVLVGVGSATLEGSLDLAREARDAGAAGLLLPPPHFFAYDQADLREFYLQFARQIEGGTAVYLSDLPAPGAHLDTATALELLGTGCFTGVEDGAGSDSLQRLAEAAVNTPWQILATDAAFSQARSAGANAGISAAACAVPELMAALERALAAQNSPRIAELDGRLREFVGWADQFPVPVAVKAATGLRRIQTGPPAVPLSPEKQARMEQFRAWFPGWLGETLKAAQA